MLFINPVDTIASLGKYAASAGLSKGFNKLREHYHLSDNDLKDYATARNVVLGTLAAGGVAAVMVNPVTRVALCTLLSMTYTMSLITLNLMMIGLYLSWMGMKGLGAVASTVAQEFMSGFNETTNSPNVPTTPHTFTKPVHKPAFNVEEAVEEFVAETRASELPRQQAVLGGNSTSNELVDEFVAQYTDELETAPRSPLQEVSEDNQTLPTDNDLVAAYTEDAKRTDTMVEDFVAEQHPNVLQRDQAIVDKDTETVDELPPSTTDVDQFDDSWLEDFEKEQQRKTTSVAVPQLDVDEFLEWEKTQGTGAQWTSEIAKHGPTLARVQKHVSHVPGTDKAQEWAAEFAQQQARGSGRSLLKYAGGALVVGAGVFAAWQLYKTMQEMQRGEEVEMTEQTYVNISGKDFPENDEHYESPTYDFVTGNWGMFGKV